MMATEKGESVQKLVDRSKAILLHCKREGQTPEEQAASAAIVLEQAEVITSLLANTVFAVNTLHKITMVHRDIKLDNAVVVKDGKGGQTVKLIDFVQSQRHGTRLDDATGSLKSMHINVLSGFIRDWMADGKEALIVEDGEFPKGWGSLREVEDEITIVGSHMTLEATYDMDDFALGMDVYVNSPFTGLYHEKLNEISLPG